MKRLLLLVATLLTSFTFISCDKGNGKDDPKDDPIIDYPYSYYEPYLMWGATKEEVRQFMSSTYPSWNLDASPTSDREMLFIDGKYKAVSMLYTFNDGKLEKSTITYPFQINSFDNLKSDIEDRYKVKMRWEGFFGGIESYSAHSAEKNMDITLSGADSKELFYMISAIFKSTGPAPSDKIKFDITPSNKATLNYTDLLTILLTFPEAREVSLYKDFLKEQAFSLVDSQGSVIWKIDTSFGLFTILGNEITINVPISRYDRLTTEGDYTFVITPNTILVDGKMLPEQHITYHLTAIPPVLEPFELIFDSKVTNKDELHFHMPDGIEYGGCDFHGGTLIYDEENNKAGDVYNFGQIDATHFCLILRMTAPDQSKTYHFDLAEGMLHGFTKFGDVPSAAATVIFGL